MRNHAQIKYSRTHTRGRARTHARTHCVNNTYSDNRNTTGTSHVAAGRLGDGRRRFMTDNDSRGIRRTVRCRLSVSGPTPHCLRRDTPLPTGPRDALPDGPTRALWHSGKNAMLNTSPHHHTHTHARTHVRTHTHTHTRTHAHTHTHTHTFSLHTNTSKYT